MVLTEGFWVYVLLGLFIGALLSWLLARIYLLQGSITRKELAEQYILKTVYNNLQEQADLYRDDLEEKTEEIRILSTKLGAREQDLLHLEEKLLFLKDEMAALQASSRLEFEQLANRLFEEKTLHLSTQNRNQMDTILSPFKQQIKAFEEVLERRYLEETKDRVSLHKEIEQLRTLNTRLSVDANNLALALKGDQKTQGSWGEYQLETILERAGLQKDVHYKSQVSFTDSDGNQKRPDFLIYLPDGKHIIIDSKVSLVAYERYFSNEQEGEKQQSIVQHVDSLRRHIKDLHSKNYTQLYQISSPDYLLLFVPIEPALQVAVQHDPNLFLDALDKNIVLVSVSTLLATLRTVSFIWRQDKQTKSVQEIAHQSGLLYDKFVAFVEDLQAVGQQLDKAQGAWQDAMNKLVLSKKFGDTLVGRAERIKNLGAKSNRQLPSDLLPDQD